MTSENMGPRPEDGEKQRHGDGERQRIHERKTVNGIEIIVTGIGINNYEIYFPQIVPGEEGLHNQVIRIIGDEVVAKKIFDFATRLAETENDVYKIYTQTEEYAYSPQMTTENIGVYQPPHEAEKQQLVHERKTVKGTEIIVTGIGINNYEIYFPQIVRGKKAKKKGVDEQVIRIIGDEVVAKKIFDFATKLAETENDVYKIYTQVKEYANTPQMTVLK